MNLRIVNSHKKQWLNLLTLLTVKIIIYYVETQPRRLSATIAALQAAMEILREQLAAKDAIIADKDAQIRTMSDRLADLAARVNEIADKSIVALQQRHMLDAAEMQQAAEQPEERRPWWKRIGKKT